MIDEESWARFEAQGFLELGQVADDAMIAAMQQRIDDIMLGRADVDYARMLMQLDSTDGAYESAGEQTKGFKGSTLAYRKIEQLEDDPLFLAYMRLPLFEEIARRVYGNIAIAAFRAMFMNKPARQGTVLPLHQDRWRALDRDPLITLYTALDRADEHNGCVEIIPGTHHELLNPSHPSGFLTPEMANRFVDDPRRRLLRLEAGEVVLMHNWMLHASGVNRSDNSRRAFSVCLMDAATMSLRYNRLVARGVIFDAVAA
ncbi:MAG: phytanoyl-CoA dioxygenase family protein [Pseudomonadota bacterium]